MTPAIPATVKTPCELCGREARCGANGQEEHLRMRTPYGDQTWCPWCTLENRAGTYHYMFGDATPQQVALAGQGVAAREAAKRKAADEAYILSIQREVAGNKRARRRTFWTWFFERLTS